MHKYLRSIGFRNYGKKEFDEWLYGKALVAPDVVTEALDMEGNEILELRKEVSAGMGICMRGFRTHEGRFVMDYYFPYREAVRKSNALETSVIPQTDRNGLYGMNDDTRLGLDLVYYVQDMMKFLKSDQSKNSKVFFGGTSLMGLSSGGKIIMPVQKTDEAIERTEKAKAKRSELLLAAREGDESAYEALSVEEMDTYNELAVRAVQEDVYSIIDTSFMPSGVEMDKYMIVAEITGIHRFLNKVSKQTVYVFSLKCNQMEFDLTVNEADLLGVPEVGRRFKGDMWLQGKVNA